MEISQIFCDLLRIYELYLQTEEMLQKKLFELNVLSLRCKPGKGKKPLYPISDALFAQESEHNPDLCKMSLDAPILGLKSNVVSYF